jgi:hypothetical protein
VCVVGAELFFFADIVCFVDFLVVTLLLPEVLLAERDVALAGALVELWLVGTGAADASMRTFVFVARDSARTCLTALVCSSRVIRNSGWPSGLASQ